MNGVQILNTMEMLEIDTDTTIRKWFVPQMKATNKSNFLVSFIIEIGWESSKQY